MATSSASQVLGGLGAAGLAAGKSYSTLPCPDSAVEDNPAWESQRVILAVFLGGCTFSEIAALRFLGKERGRSGRGRLGGRQRPGDPAEHMQPSRLCAQGPAPAEAVGRGWQGGTRLSGKIGGDGAGSVGAALRHCRGTDGPFLQGASSSS